MIFNSLTFVAFFAIVLALHAMPFPWKTKKINLLIASYIFYSAWNPPFVMLLWLSTVVDWFAAQKLAASVIAMTLNKTRIAVAKIRAHGGDVIFVRPPSAPELRKHEDERLSRARGWDALLAAAKVKGIHADDVPAMKGLVIPEYSHLSRACAAVFTDSYVRQLAQLTPRVRLLPGAPPPLSQRACVPVTGNAKAQIAERQ